MCVNRILSILKNDDIQFIYKLNFYVEIIKYTDLLDLRQDFIILIV